MLSNYLPILIFLVIATGLAVLLLVLGSGSKARKASAS